jgi:hypothetical protein
MISPHINECTKSDMIIQEKTAWFRTSKKFVPCVSGLSLKRHFRVVNTGTPGSIEKGEIASLAQGVQMIGCPHVNYIFGNSRSRKNLVPEIVPRQNV